MLEILMRKRQALKKLQKRSLEQKLRNMRIDCGEEREEDFGGEDGSSDDDQDDGDEGDDEDKPAPRRAVPQPSTAIPAAKTRAAHSADSLSESIKGLPVETEDGHGYTVGAEKDSDGFKFSVKVGDLIKKYELAVFETALLKKLPDDLVKEKMLPFKTHAIGTPPPKVKPRREVAAMSKMNLPEQP